MKRIFVLLDTAIRCITAMVTMFVAIGMFTYGFEGWLSALPLLVCAYLTAVPLSWIAKHTHVWSHITVAVCATVCVFFTIVFAAYLYASYHQIAGILLAVCSFYAYYRYPIHLWGALRFTARPSEPSDR